MRLLLDTQVILWFAATPEQLPKRAFKAIKEADERCVSFASAWEYCAKRAKFPGRLAKPFEELMTSDYRRLGASFELYRYAENLPLIHHDPIDRMLVAQALDLGLTMVTADKTIRSYPVETLW